MAEQAMVVTEVQREAARARVKIDIAHGRTTPEIVLKIANAKIVSPSTDGDGRDSV